MPSQLLGFREALEPVEKVTTGPMGGVENIQNGILDTRTGVRKGHEGMFQQAPLIVGNWVSDRYGSGNLFPLTRTLLPCLKNPVYGWVLAELIWGRS